MLGFVLVFVYFGSRARRPGLLASKRPAKSSKRPAKPVFDRLGPMLGQCWGNVGAMLGRFRLTLLT